MTSEAIMREIVTKAVCGKGQVLQQNIVDIPISTPEQVQILGNFVSNAKMKSAVPLALPKNKKLVKIEGQYDVHVWYSVGQDTYSVKKTISYIETVPVATYSSEDFTNAHATGEIIAAPKCNKAYVVEDSDHKIIKLEIEQELAAEVIGLTKLYVKSVPSETIQEDEIFGQELIAPQIPDSGFLIPEFYADSVDDLSDLTEDDYSK